MEWCFLIVLIICALFDIQNFKRVFSISVLTPTVTVEVISYTRTTIVSCHLIKPVGTVGRCISGLVLIKFYCPSLIVVDRHQSWFRACKFFAHDRRASELCCQRFPRELRIVPEKHGAFSSGTFSVRHAPPVKIVIIICDGWFPVCSRLYVISVEFLWQRKLQFHCISSCRFRSS